MRDMASESGFVSVNVWQTNLAAFARVQRRPEYSIEWCECGRQISCLCVACGPIHNRWSASAESVCCVLAACFGSNFLSNLHDLLWSDAARRRKGGRVKYSAISVCLCVLYWIFSALAADLRRRCAFWTIRIVCCAHFKKYTRAPFGFVWLEMCKLLKRECWEGSTCRHVIEMCVILN